MKTIWLILTLAVVSTVSARTWTSTDGRTIEGELVAKTAEAAVIEREGGAKVTVPLAMLSETDQKFVKKTKVAAPPAAPLTLKEALVKAYAKQREGYYTLNLIAAPGGEKYAAAITNSQSLVAELQGFEALAKPEDAADNALLIDLRRTIGALTKAQADKSQVAEAVRSVGSLKAASTK